MKEEDPTQNLALGVLFYCFLFGVRYLHWSLAIFEFVPRKASFEGNTLYQRFFHSQSANPRLLVKKGASYPLLVKKGASYPLHHILLVSLPK